MHTLFDYISNVNATQYGLSLLFIFGFKQACYGVVRRAALDNHHGRQGERPLY
jgi:hypothetical protein